MKWTVALLLGIVAVGYWLLMAVTSSERFVRSDVATLNRAGQMSSAELAVACEDMSRWSFVSGLSDGAFNSLGGRTSYYRSSCFMELARTTLQPQHCDHVHTRRALFNSGASLSRGACLQVVSAGLQQRAENVQQQAKFNQRKASAFRLATLTVMADRAGVWTVHAQAQGAMPGNYLFELRNLAAAMADPLGLVSSSQQQLRESTFEYAVTITSAQLQQCAACRADGKRIYPLALSLSLLPPDGIGAGRSATVISILNTSISLE